MKIFEKPVGFFERFWAHGSRPHFFLFPLLLSQAAIQLPNLTDLCLIDIFIAKLGGNSFRVCDTSI
jgi:hypothetical protein